MSRLVQAIGASSMALFITASSMAPASAAPFRFDPGSVDNPIAPAAFHHGPVWRHGGWSGGRGAALGLGIAGGALLGGLLANNYGYHERPYGYYEHPPIVVYRTGNAHVAWCYDRYRSYRASDNTFQPNHGPRQQCIAPMDY